MMSRYRLLFAAVALLSFGATGANATPASRQPLVTSADPASVLAGFTMAGFTAHMDKDSDGDPLVVVVNPAGGVYNIFFFGCQNHAACQQIQFRVTISSFPANAALTRRINDWNAQSSFLRASTLADGKVALDTKLQLVPAGLSQPLFAAIVRSWTGDIDRFYAFAASTGK